MALNIPQLVQPIIAAMKPELVKHWHDAKDFAEAEALKTAQTLALVAKLHAENKIDASQARALLEMQKQASQAVLLAIEGIGLLAAQRSINAGLAAVAQMVNGVVGFALL